MFGLLHSPCTQELRLSRMREREARDIRICPAAEAAQRSVKPPMDIDIWQEQMMPVRDVLTAKH